MYSVCGALVMGIALTMKPFGGIKVFDHSN